MTNQITQEMMVRVDRTQQRTRRYENASVRSATKGYGKEKKAKERKKQEYVYACDRSILSPFLPLFLCAYVRLFVLADSFVVLARARWIDAAYYQKKGTAWT